MASAIKNENEKKYLVFLFLQNWWFGGYALGQLTLSILMDFPKQIDTISMGKSICVSRANRLNFLN